MHSIQEVRDVADAEAVFDVVEAALSALGGLDVDTLSTEGRLVVLGRCERLRRLLPVTEHPLINALVAQATPAELGGKPAWRLAERLLISRGEARARIEDAAVLVPRRTLLGVPQPPILAACAAAQRDATLGVAQIRVIRHFLATLPATVDAAARERAEAQLAELGTRFIPEELRKLAERMADCLNPDGNYTDEDRARRRGIVLGRQGADGMSTISGQITPGLRAKLEPVLARLGAPGMANPDDPDPCLRGTPTQTNLDLDHRNAAQRDHDALDAALDSCLGSGQLGTHNGLRATIIVSVELKELETATGLALTAGGTRLPWTEVIALAAHAYHYLRIYDGGQEIALIRTKRLASPGQRLALYARHRGCTHPGCPIPAYLTEVHHNHDYATTGITDVNDLTLQCGPHHQIITTSGWKTRNNHRGETETIPPEHLDHGQSRVNHYWHPERLLHDGDGDSEAGDGDEEHRDAR